MTRVCAEVAAWALAVGAAAHQAPAEHDLANATREREKATAQLRLEVHFEQRLVKGVFDAKMATHKPGQKLGPTPSADLVLESDNVLLLDGNKVRLDFNHPSFHLDKLQVIQRASVMVSDGAKATTWDKDGGGGTPRLIIRRDARTDMIRTQFWYSLMVQVRGMTPGVAPLLVTGLKLSPGTKTIEGLSCQCYLNTLAQGVEMQYWVCPERNHSLRQIVTLKSGRVIERHEVSYSASDTTVPSGWTFTAFDDAGRVKQSVRATVRVVDRSPAVKPSQFVNAEDVPGSRVDDERTDREYRVEADGRHTTTAVDGVLVEPTNPSPRDGWFGRYRWLLGATLCGLLAVAFVWRLRRRSAI